MAYENHRRGVGRATVRKVCDNRPHLHRAADHKVYENYRRGAGRATVHKVCDNRLPLRRAVGHKVYENRRRGASRVVGHRAFYSRRGAESRVCENRALGPRPLRAGHRVCRSRRAARRSRPVRLNAARHTACENARHPGAADGTPPTTPDRPAPWCGADRVCDSPPAHADDHPRGADGENPAPRHRAAVGHHHGAGGTACGSRPAHVRHARRGADRAVAGGLGLDTAADTAGGNLGLRLLRRAARHHGQHDKACGRGAGHAEHHQPRGRDVFFDSRTR